MAIEPVVHEFIQSGQFSPEEGASFLDDLRQQSAAGRTFWPAPTTR